MGNIRNSLLILVLYLLPVVGYSQKLFETSIFDLFSELNYQKRDGGNVSSYDVVTKGSANAVEVIYKDGGRGSFWYSDNGNGKLYHIAYCRKTEQETVQKFSEISNRDGYIRANGENNYKIKGSIIYFSLFKDDFNRSWYCWEAIPWANTLSE